MEQNPHPHNQRKETIHLCENENRQNADEASGDEKHKNVS